jgi:sulfur relay (sulfurtransferase) complex TusBCD TusD component (DsrE family)
MKNVRNLLLALALAVSSAAGPAIAGNADPLFVNLTTDDSHRASMAIVFGGNQLERGHPLTIFLNDRGVLVASKANASKFPEQQKALAGLQAKGATILVCPMCMRHYGVSEADLLPGLKVGSPDLTGSALFAEGARALTW